MKRDIFMPAKDYNNYMSQYMLKRYHNRRAKAIKKLGSKCANCFATKELEIDHINKDEKSFAISKLWSCSQEKFDAELEKCQLLCKNCHTQKSAVEHKLWLKESRLRTCECGLTFANHSKYAGHKRWCKQ